MFDADERFPIVLVSGLICLAIFCIVILAGIALYDISTHPDCEEDEAVWWVAPDQRGCVNIETLIIMESHHTGG